MGGVLDFQSQLEITGLGWTSTEAAFRREGDSIGQVATGHAPDVRRNAAGGMEKNVEFHTRLDRGQRFDYHVQWGSLRREQTGKTNQNCNRSNNRSEIHFAAFDFTLATA